MLLTKFSLNRTTPKPTTAAPTTAKPTTTKPGVTVETGSNDSTNPNATTTQEVNSECREHHDQAWSGRESRMINACVNVCTVTTTKFEGNKLIHTNIEKINGPCGAGQY